MAGSVLVGEKRVTKAGMNFDETVDIRIREVLNPYVSRGGLKLEGAVRAFGLEIYDWVCVDIGSSTGGFTQFLLQNGARKVYAVDVDVRQLDWRVRQDARVHPIELNARFLQPDHIGETVDLVTIDASFISLTILLPRIPPLLRAGGYCLALVKPQFEVGRESVGKGGIVRDPQLHRDSIHKVVAAAKAVSLHFQGQHESPITGREGNREFFALFRRV